MSDTKELIDAGFAQILDAVNADDPKREVFIRVRDLRKETADSFSLLRRQVEELEAALENIAGFGKVPLFQEWESGLRDIIRAMIDCARNALAASSSPSLQDERERAAREEERERCAKIAESEPEPAGDAPVELQLVPLEDALHAAVRATKKCIAAAIRSSTERTG